MPETVFILILCIFCAYLVFKTNCTCYLIVNFFKHNGGSLGHFTRFYSGSDSNVAETYNFVWRVNFFQSLNSSRPRYSSHKIDTLRRKQVFCLKHSAVKTFSKYNGIISRVFIYSCDSSFISV